MKRLRGGTVSPVSIRHDLLLLSLWLLLSSIQQKNNDSRRLQEQVFPNFPTREPNELNLPPRCSCGILAAWTHKVRGNWSIPPSGLVAARGARSLWDRPLGSWWHQQRAHSRLSTRQDVPVWLGLAAPPPASPARAKVAAVPHPLAAGALCKHEVQTLRSRERIFTSARKAGWKCEVGSLGCLARRQGPGLRLRCWSRATFLSRSPTAFSRHLQCRCAGWRWQGARGAGWCVKPGEPLLLRDDRSQNSSSFTPPYPRWGFLGWFGLSSSAVLQVRGWARRALSPGRVARTLRRWTPQRWS